MALLCLAHAHLREGLEVATIDHGLRPEASDECALVASQCAAWGLPCEVLQVTVDEGNVQDRARAARYAALGKWAADRHLASVATAHHADDQAETILMRLNRGSGLAGLAGIRSSAFVDRCPVPVIRPLLGFRKRELRDIVRSAGVAFAEDPSNRDASFERVRMRQHLEGADWIDPAALARSAAHLQEADRSLDALAQEYWDRHASVADDRVSVPTTSVADIDARLIARAIATLGGTVSSGQVLAFLKSGDRRANIAGVLLDRQEEAYLCTPEPPRRSG